MTVIRGGKTRSNMIKSAAVADGRAVRGRRVHFVDDASKVLDGLRLGAVRPINVPKLASEALALEPNHRADRCR